MYQNKKVLAIIPARGGSERLPGKNIKPLAGKPLIFWTINAAKKSIFIDELIVSTDSRKIAEISKRYGARVPFFRPSDLSGNNSSTVDVVVHAINYLSNAGEEYDYVVVLQPTSPLRTHDDIDNAIRQIDDEVRVIVSVCETEHSPLWSNMLPDNLSMKDFLKPELSQKRSQDLPKYYRLNGAVFVADINYFLKMKTFYGEKTKAYVMPKIRSIDIDDKFDFLCAECLLKKMIIDDV